MANMNDIVRQAQLMQKKLAKIEEELNAKTFDASSGGGMVKAVVTGNLLVKSLTISPEVVQGGDVEMLEDLIVAAVNEAMRIARETKEREMGALTGNIKLPGVF